MRRRAFIAAFSGAAAALFGSGTWAQTAIKIVVPAPAGGAGDIVARILTEQVGRAQGLTLVIENRPGAGTIIGTEAVAHAGPDGSTLLITAPYLVIAPHLRKVNFDPLTAFEPICHMVSSPGIIVVNGSSPYRTLGDFLDAARARPGELTFAAAGPGIETKLNAQGFISVGSCGADFAELLRKQFDHYGRVIREANIKAE
jgi:tripartite-type tricarboxylate transporter receptor subunit TctC